MKLMNTYGTLEPKNKRTWRKFKRGGVMETNEFMNTEVVANNCLFQHQVDDNRKRRHAPTTMEKTWATKYWPDSFFAWHLDVSEVNANHYQSYFKDNSDELPQIEFRRRLAK